jgi:DNA-binding response OmpR family regulator
MDTILLVDDDPKILRPLQILLEADGYRVMTAPDGELAAQVTATERPDLIVTDWMMPRMDGLALCQWLKADGATADIPVVMLSAAHPPNAAHASLWNIALQKPTSIVRLLDVIARLLGKQHAALAYRQRANIPRIDTPQR